ncbi:hypothetical protein FOL47_001823 [Perkinsus chesapeaki]|uniref:Large ribosomal subunit protein uL23m n=1 Tax=Perkinsus chesapeaki TaxID=330153 RepID=A0A7J6MHA4_PERCH|nr:hypothetical protein FOL47_001823 [Perkinsus chesapeaki]
MGEGVFVTMTVDNRLQLLGVHESPVGSPVFGESGDLYVMEEGSGEVYRYMGIDEWQHPDAAGEPDPSTEIRVAACGSFAGSPEGFAGGCQGFAFYRAEKEDEVSHPTVSIVACDTAQGALIKVTRTIRDNKNGASKLKGERLMVPTDLGSEVEKSMEQSTEVLVKGFEGLPLLGPHSVTKCTATGFTYFTDSGPLGESGLGRPLGSLFAIDPVTSMLIPLITRSLAYPAGVAVTQREGCQAMVSVVYVAETMKNRVLRFIEYPAGSGSYQPSVFHQLSGRLGPTALAVSGAGHLFVAHNDIEGLSGTGRILALSEEGEVISTITLPHADVTGLAVSPDQKYPCTRSRVLDACLGSSLSRRAPHTTRHLLGPPKAPRNVFFPWFNFVVHRSGMYLEPNRIAFRVPVHLTKFEIREYLRKIYGVKAIRCTAVVRFPRVMKNRARAYYKNGAQFKKAIVTCEETIPNTVKMLSSSSSPHLNPAIHRNKLSMQYDYIPYRFGQDRKNDWKPRHRHAWREPIPLLLRGEHGHPTITKREEMALRMDTTLPHQDVMNTKKAMLDGTPRQAYPRIDLAEIRRRKYAFQHQFDHLKGSENVHIDESEESGGPEQEPLFRL